MKTSALWNLGTQDFLKGLLMAVLGGVVSIVMASVNTGALTFNLTDLWHGAIVGGVAYLAKNFATPAQVVTKADVNSPAK